MAPLAPGRRGDQAWRMANDLPWQEPEGWPEDAERNRLIGDWYLYQRRGGHRTSTDDVLTAWFAAERCCSPVARYLDLGCGIGSVLLMTAHRLRPQHSQGVEAQPQSFAMATRGVSELPEGAPTIDVAHSDFRQFVPEAPFDLITGSPPYFPLGTGVLPDDSQRRACRFEARGGVEAYCATAARCLAPGGRVYLVFQTVGDQRVSDAASDAGLHITARVDATMKVERMDPFLSVYEFARQEAPLESYSLTIRSSDGALHPSYRAARRTLGVESVEDASGS